MTDAEERREANQAADAAMEAAKKMQSRADRIAEGWRRSRLDNNFRLMLRALGLR